MERLFNISPLDGRYRDTVNPLRAYFSESALIRYRTCVEVEYLIALSMEPRIKEVRKFSTGEIKKLRNIYLNFSEKDAFHVKQIEMTTNHDVKAVEYFIKEKLQKMGLKKYIEFVHFALTSEDVNNLAYAWLVRDAMRDEMLPKIIELYKNLVTKARAWKKIPLLARTHGQPATPTNVGKEFMVFAKRLERQILSLRQQEFLGKLNGATGTFAAHVVAYPEVNWIQFSERFIASLGLTPSLVTTQIEPHDYQAELYHNLMRVNSILTDLARDVWMYISRDYFSQTLKAGEVGSSTMPHKVNPIDFENAEGNFGLANAIFGHLAGTLPISRLQRDLTDSTLQRNIGTAFGYTYIALQSLMKGLGKLQVNKEVLKQDLADHPEVLAEALQTVMRKYGVPKPYEKLKELTRGKKVTMKDIQIFILTLEIPKDAKMRLMRLTPGNYTGIY